MAVGKGDDPLSVGTQPRGQQTQRGRSADQYSTRTVPVGQPSRPTGQGWGGQQRARNPVDGKRQLHVVPVGVERFLPGQHHHLVIQQVTDTADKGLDPPDTRGKVVGDDQSARGIHPSALPIRRRAARP